YALLQKALPRAACPLAVASICALAAFLAVVGAHRVASFQDESTLWEETLAYYPDDPLAHINLAIQLNRSGRYEEGLSHLQTDVRSDPYRYLWHYNLARTYEDLGRVDDAIEEYKQTLLAKPDHVAAHNNLGRILSDRGQYDESIALFEEAIRCKPDFSAAHN